MKKVLLIIILVLSTNIASAQSRGIFTGVWASSYSIGTTQTTITLPFNSRDITIRNASTYAVCVDLRGGTITHTCRTSGDPLLARIFQLDGDTTLTFKDFATNSISFRVVAGSGTASPVTVIAIY